MVDIAIGSAALRAEGGFSKSLGALPSGTALELAVDDLKRDLVELGRGEVRLSLRSLRLSFTFFEGESS